MEQRVKREASKSRSARSTVCGVAEIKQGRYGEVTVVQYSKPVHVVHAHLCGSGRCLAYLKPHRPNSRLKREERRAGYYCTVLYIPTLPSCSLFTCGCLIRGGTAAKPKFAIPQLGALRLTTGKSKEKQDHGSKTVTQVIENSTLNWPGTRTSQYDESAVSNMTKATFEANVRVIRSFG